MQLFFNHERAALFNLSDDSPPPGWASRTQWNGSLEGEEGSGKAASAIFWGALWLNPRHSATEHIVAAWRFPFWEPQPVKSGVTRQAEEILEILISFWFITRYGILSF